jgi:hypothetical protein
MASFQAIVSRKSTALGRISAVREKLKSLTGVEYSDAPVTGRDQELARVQELENTAGFLEALAGSIEAAQPKESKPKTKAKK